MTPGSLHWARRLTFGFTPALRSELEIGFDPWFDRQLDPASIDDIDCDRRLWALTGLSFDIGRLLPEATPVLDGLGLTPVVDEAAELLSNAAMSLDALEAALLPLHHDRLRRVISELRLASVVRATYSKRQLFELLVDFWWNHLNVWPGKNLIVAGLTVSADRDTIRPHAMGRFADLLQASAASPAMLTYLDNWINSVRSPNENYGRELLELHTVGVESGFTEADVRNSARVFTGWTIDLLTGRFRFEPDRHDTGPKQVLDWSSAGRSGDAGIEEGRSLLDHLAHHPATARHLATKLVRRFVTDDPPSELVESAARVYLDHDTAIVPVLRHIVASEAFAASADTKVRRPLDFFVAALRSTGAQLADPLGPSTDAGTSVDEALLRLGQRPFDAASPAGYPERADGWLGAGLLAHWTIAHELPRGRFPGIALGIDDLCGPATTAGETVEQVLGRLHGEVDPDRRTTILSALEAAEDDTFDHEQRTQAVALALCSAEAYQR